jgi:hypothetical protein
MTSTSLLPAGAAETTVLAPLLVEKCGAGASNERWQRNGVENLAT